MNREYKRNCPQCNRELIYRGKWAKYSCQTAMVKELKCHECGHPSGHQNGFFGKTHTEEIKRKISEAGTGRHPNEKTKRKIRAAVKNRYSNPEEREKTGKLVKIAMHTPEIRRRHIEGLRHSKWIKVRTDKGQLELIEKWNRLGFHFEPNYQIHTDEDLFYIDGYDKYYNVVFEYDSKYHKKSNQQEKDRIRQNKIIDILNPKKFWRFDAITREVTNVLKEGG